MMWSFLCIGLILVSAAQGFLFDIEKEDNEDYNTVATPSHSFDTEEPTTCQTEKESVGFKLYTRYSRNDGECIRVDDGSLKSSYFNKSHKVMFFIHGYMGSGDDWYVNDLKNTCIDKLNVDFIVVDWSIGSWQLPLFAVLEAESVALTVAEFIRNLTSLYKISLKSIHVIGHSMGARVVGKMGSNLNPKLGRVTVLDPMPADYRGSADFVDVIHSTVLSDWAKGDVQFLPNNGRMSGLIPWASGHMKSIYLYQHSIIGQCAFKAYQCDSYTQFTDGECDFNDYNYMGYYANPNLARGSLYLQINNEAPFCDTDNNAANS